MNDYFSVGGARILNTFYSKFIPKLDAIDAKANLSEKEILTVIHNSTVNIIYSLLFNDIEKIINLHNFIGCPLRSLDT